jgi:hypothetical protein
VDTPRCQGACGALGGDPPIRLSDVEAEVDDSHGSLLVISLDGRPLKASRRILVQFVASEKPYGYRVEGDRIADLGGHPLLVKEADLTVILLGNPHIRKATALDAHGYARAGAEVARKAGRLKIPFPKDALYVLVE